MSFDLGTLFEGLKEHMKGSEDKQSVTQEPNHKIGLLDDLDQIWNATVTEFSTGAADQYARDVILALVRERDSLQAKVADQALQLEGLERRVYSKELPTAGHTLDVVQRINRIEKDNTRLRSEIAQLKDNLKATETENVKVCNENDGKARKLKGASKKVRDAKKVAVVEEEKAKGAISDKQRHLASERKMRKEHGEARAALQAQMKINEDLRAELEVEQSGTPHMRDTAEDVNNTVVVLPVQFEMRRSDFLKLKLALEAHQMAITDNLTRWYNEWKKPKLEVKQVVGANYVDDEKSARVYEDMVEMPNGYLETGAEHDGWRSRRALEVVCRQAEDKHNA